MTKGLTGIPSLSYLGVNAGSPPNIRMYNRAPTINDWQNFIVGDIWLNITPTPPITREVWILVALLHNQATWQKLFGGSGGNAITNLIDDNGNIVTPDLTTNGITVHGGANINTDGSVPHIITVNLDTSILQPATTADQSAGVYSVGGVPYLHGYGVTNVFVGGAGNFTLNNVNARANIGIGYQSLESLVGSGINLGDANVAVGEFTLHSVTDGGNNVAIGHNSAPGITTGSFNVCIGQQSCGLYVGNEEHNTCLGYYTLGVAGESHTLRIGNATGVGLGELTTAYICGIYNTASGVGYLGTAPKMVAIGSDNKITSSPNIYMPTTTVDEGQVIQAGTTILHTGLGTNKNNIFVGSQSGNLTATLAYGNTALGMLSLSSMDTTDTSSHNLALGFQTLRYLQAGYENTACGTQSLEFLVSGSSNTCLGNVTGWYYTGSESSNILIGDHVFGTAGESNTLRIGRATGTGDGELNLAFIQGIRGITTTNANAIAVLIDSAGQLGTVSSSIRYKDNVKDISDISDIISKLRPVEFNYKQHKTTDIQYGLIAEEVASVWPEMMVYDKEGQPETLKYQHLPIILLKEIQNLRKRIEQLEQASSLVPLEAK